jgi:hypothetical protein
MCSGNLIGYLGFFRREVFIGEGAMSEEGPGGLTELQKSRRRLAAVGRAGEGEAEAEGADGGEVGGTEEEAPAAGRGVGAVSAVDGPIAAAAVGRGCSGHRM